MSSKNRSKKIYFIVVLILLVGTLLRIYDLSSESIWMDETLSLKFSHDINGDYGNPPLYFLFLNHWMRLFGNSEFSIRFPSAIFGVISVVLVYYLANFLFNKKIALISALMLSVNPFHIYLSQQARMYSLFTLFSLLSLFYFFKILKEGRKKNMILYLAGLQGINPELYEVAAIDGANGWQKFWNITWPLLSPTTFFIVIMGVIGGLQGGFQAAFVMTHGGPNQATTTISYGIYNNAFHFYHMGKAAAISWALFLLVFIFTLINWRFGGKRVHYQ